MTGIPRSAGVSPRHLLGHVDQRTNEPVFPLPRVSDGGKRAQPPGEHRIAQQRFAEVIGGMAEGNDIRFQSPRNLIYRAPSKPAAQIAPMLRLLVDQTDGRIIAVAGPLDTAAGKILSDGLDGPQELPLFHGESANREIDWSPLGQQHQRFNQRHRIFAARHRYGHAIAIADHAEAMDRFAHFPQQGLFKFHEPIVT